MKHLNIDTTFHCKFRKFEIKMPGYVEKSKPMIGAMFRGPGPSYGLPDTLGFQKHDFTKSKAPAYTFGLKGKYKDKDECSPGPAYFIPEKLTRSGPDGAPKYSLKGRPNLQASFRTPGPGKKIYMIIQLKLFVCNGKGLYFT